MTKKTTTANASLTRGAHIKDQNTSDSPKNGDMVVLLCDVVEFEGDSPYVAYVKKVIARRGDIGQWLSVSINSGANVRLENGTCVAMVEDSVQVLTALELLALESE